MPPRNLKPNQVLKLRPMPGKRIVRKTWALGEKKMVAIPVTRESSQRGFAIDNITRKFMGFDSKKIKSKRWIIALVRRDGPTDFTVLKRAVGTYNEKNPGERVVGMLAKEFGLIRPPKKVSVLRPQEINRKGFGNASP